MRHLPDRASSKPRHPTRFPNRGTWPPLRSAAGIAPISARSILADLSRRGWSFWLVGSVVTGMATTYRAMILEPRNGAMWARSGDFATPVEALAQVTAICLANPPWEGE